MRRSPSCPRHRWNKIPARCCSGSSLLPSSGRHWTRRADGRRDGGGERPFAQRSVVRASINPPGIQAGFQIPLLPLVPCQIVDSVSTLRNRYVTQSSNIGHSDMPRRLQANFGSTYSSACFTNWTFRASQVHHFIICKTGLLKVFTS